MTEILTELDGLRMRLAELTDWANEALDDEHSDAHLIAEYLTGSLAALVDGTAAPRAPYVFDGVSA